jgi:hypothetical protein
MKRLGNALQLAGAALVCIGASLLQLWLGLVLGGVALVVVGYLIEKADDHGSG